MDKQIKSGFRVVPDTNIIVAAEIAINPQSPNKEIKERWFNDEFVVLYSVDTQTEYAAKLAEEGVDSETIEELLESIFVLGEFVDVKHYHLPHYPDDPDDVCFVLCADNGQGTHIISYDNHLLVLNDKY